ncbi:MAG: hypothetical protein GQ564_06015 [Bacteroidales bacterium]|nr:hypothetical protein [Bacteroidales bacterium]
MKNNIKEKSKKGNFPIVIVPTIVIVAILVIFIIYILFPREVNFIPYSPSITISADSLKGDTCIIQKIDSLIFELKNTQNEFALSKDSFLSISHLNGFYAILIAFITLIIAFFGFISWNKINKIEDDIEVKMSPIEVLNENYKIIKKDVEYLKEKRDLAQWVEKKIENDKSFITDNGFITTSEDRINEEKIINCVSETNKDNIWLKLFYAKNKLYESKHEEVYKIYKLIEIEIPIIKNSFLPTQFYHLYGQLFWEYYKKEKERFYDTDDGLFGNWEEWRKKSWLILRMRKSQKLPQIKFYMTHCTIIIKYSISKLQKRQLIR